MKKATTSGYLVLESEGSNKYKNIAYINMLCVLFEWLSHLVNFFREVLGLIHPFGLRVSEG